MWSHIRWTAGFEAEIFKTMMREIFHEIGDWTQYSYETKKFYVRNSELEKLDKILAKYEEDAKPFEEMFSDKGKELDEAFK